MATFLKADLKHSFLLKEENELITITSKYKSQLQSQRPQLNHHSWDREFMQPVYSASNQHRRIPAYVELPKLSRPWVIPNRTHHMAVTFLQQPYGYPHSAWLADPDSHMANDSDGNSSGPSIENQFQFGQHDA